MIKADTAAMMLKFDPALQPPLQRFFVAWMIWIHNGRFFGVIGQVILVPTGIMLALLFPTGFYMWWRKRRLRLKRDARVTA